LLDPAGGKNCFFAQGESAVARAAAAAKALHVTNGGAEKVAASGNGPVVVAFGKRARACGTHPPCGSLRAGRGSGHRNTAHRAGARYVPCRLTNLKAIDRSLVRIRNSG
jgi:hypothetical protein